MRIFRRSPSALALLNMTSDNWFHLNIQWIRNDSQHTTATTVHRTQKWHINWTSSKRQRFGAAPEQFWFVRLGPRHLRHSFHSFASSAYYKKCELREKIEMIELSESINADAENIQTPDKNETTTKRCSLSNGITHSLTGTNKTKTKRAQSERLISVAANLSPWQYN